jgi:hypothetical protein
MVAMMLEQVWQKFLNIKKLFFLLQIGTFCGNSTHGHSAIAGPLQQDLQHSGLDAQLEVLR